MIEKLPQLLGNPKIKVIAAPCVGRCEQVPAAVVHQNAVVHATTESVLAAVAADQKWQSLPDYEDMDAYVANGGYELLKQIHSKTIEPEQIIQTMESSGLRGLGGAGFPAGKKWRIVREQTAPRLMAVNIDEGEPIVLGHLDAARDAALNMMRFFTHESCGQCTPCRVGTTKAAQLMQAKVWDNHTLDDLNQVTADASICGLGQAAPNPVRSVQKYFPLEIPSWQNSRI